MKQYYIIRYRKYNTLTKSEIKEIDPFDEEEWDHRWLIELKKNNFYNYFKYKITGIG